MSIIYQYSVIIFMATLFITGALSKAFNFERFLLTIKNYGFHKGDFLLKAYGMIFILLELFSGIAILNEKSKYFGIIISSLILIFTSFLLINNLLKGNVYFGCGCSMFENRDERITWFHVFRNMVILILIFPLFYLTGDIPDGNVSLLNKVVIGFLGLILLFIYLSVNTIISNYNKIYNKGV